MSRRRLERPEGIQVRVEFAVADPRCGQSAPTSWCSRSFRWWHRFGNDSRLCRMYHHRDLLLCSGITVRDLSVRRIVGPLRARNARSTCYGPGLECETSCRSPVNPKRTVPVDGKQPRVVCKVPANPKRTVPCGGWEVAPCRL